MFDERHFPYEQECVECEKVASITHEDVQDVPSYLATSKAAEDVKYVMTQRRGWSLESAKGPFCPDCAGSTTQ